MDARLHLDFHSPVVHVLAHQDLRATYTAAAQKVHNGTLKGPQMFTQRLVLDSQMLAHGLLRVAGTNAHEAAPVTAGAELRMRAVHTLCVETHSMEVAAKLDI